MRTFYSDTFTVTLQYIDYTVIIQYHEVYCYRISISSINLLIVITNKALYYILTITHLFKKIYTTDRRYTF